VNQVRLQRAAQYLVALRKPGPRPRSLPVGLAPQSEAEAYRLQALVSSALGAGRGCWKVAMNDAQAGTCAPVFQADLHRSGARVISPITDRIGIEPEIAFTLKQALPALPDGRHYGREQVIAAIGTAHAAIEIVISRFHSHDGAAPLDRLADNISNGGLVLGPPCDRWQELDLTTIALHLCIEGRQGGNGVFDARGGHPLGDPLLPLIWLANRQRADESGMQAGDVITTGSYAGLRYVERDTHVSVQFEGLGVAELYS
jgi:2-keto-4-pentenoate hydratase